MSLFNLKNNLQNKGLKGFTLVETLVAIAILMIAIAGPLTIASKGLTAATYAKNQVIASFLAQDLIEYVKSQEVNLGFDNFLSQFDEGSIACTFEADECNIDTTDSAANLDRDNDGQLYFSPAGGYRPSASGATASPFRRIFFISNPDGSTLTDLNTDQIKITVKIFWSTGILDNELVFESYLFDVLK